MFCNKIRVIEAVFSFLFDHVIKITKTYFSEVPYYNTILVSASLNFKTKYCHCHDKVKFSRF